MDDMNAFDRQLASVVLRRVGPSQPVNDAAIFTAITTTHSPEWRFGSMFGATKFVVAGAIVALFGGFLLSGVLTQPSDESVPNAGASATPDAATLPVVELPAEIPDGIDSGILDTPIGPARWVHLSGTADTLPDILEPVAVPSGYASLDEGHWVPCPSGDPCWEPATLWFSPDLLTWTPRPLPFDRGRASLTVSGGSYWLTVNGEPKNEDVSFDPSLWRSTDALEWEQVDPSGVEPLAPSGIEWRLAYLGGVAGEGDTILATISYVAMNSGSFLGLPAPPGEEGSDWSAYLEAAEDGVYRVLDGWGTELDRVRVEPSDGGLRVTDADTGAAISVVEGVGMELIERWAASDGGFLDDWVLVLIEDGRVDQVELPKAMTEGHGLALAGTVDGFRAWRGDEPSPQVWTSPKGREWTLDESLGDDVDGPTSAWITGPVGIVPWGHGGTYERELYWESDDGIEWQAHRPPSGDHVARLGPGWVVIVGGGLAYYPDGSEDMLPIDAGPQIEADGSDVGMRRISENTIRHSVSDGPGGRRDHWIITFEDLPTDGT